MSEVIFPRSPRETMLGWVHLPRLIDKIRLHLAGRLPADYQANYLQRGFDAAWLKAAGLDAAALVAVVRGSITDGEVCDWVRTHVQRPAEQAAFNHFVLHHGHEDDPEIRARLQQRKAQAGLGHRDDLRGFVDFIDADEKRL